MRVSDAGLACLVGVLRRSCVNALMEELLSSFAPEARNPLHGD